MKKILLRLFNIYSGEERKALVFAVLGFLWALGITSGQKLADVLFLLHVGAESLPYAYSMTACTMIVTATFFLKAFHLFNIKKILSSVLVVGILFYSFAYTCIVMDIGSDSKWLWYAFQVFGNVLFTIVGTCFWTLIDQYFHMQDGKRLYSLFASTEFIGAGSTGILMRLGWMDFHHTVLFVVILLTLTIFWLLKVISQIKPIQDDSAAEEVPEPSHSSVRGLVKTILSSRFTMLLMFGCFLTHVVLVTTEYCYLTAFDQHFAAQSVTGDSEELLSAFLGEWTAIVSFCNLCVGLFFYSRLVRRFGLSNLMPYAPTLLLFTFGGWNLSTSLFFPILGFFVVEGLLNIVDDNNITLMLNAVPSKIKYKVRIMIESFFEPIGMLVGSLLIPIIPFSAKYLGLSLACIGLATAFMLRKQYLKAIFQNLSENAIQFQRTVMEWFSSMNRKQQESIGDGLQVLLTNKDEQGRLFAIETLLGLNQDSLPRILHHIDDLSEKSKAAFLRIIQKSRFAADVRMLGRLEQWLQQPMNISLRNSLYLYLAQHGLLHPDTVMRSLNSDNRLLQGAAIIALKQPGPIMASSTMKMHSSVITKHLQALLNSKDEREVCIGISALRVVPNSKDIDRLVALIKNPSLKIAREAASAFAQIADKDCVRYAPLLISQLEISSDSELRQSCLQALVKIGDSFLVKDIIESSRHFRPNERRLTETLIAQMGKRTVPILMAIIKDSTMHDRCRLLAGRILGRVALPQLRADLHTLIKQQLDRAYFYLYHSQALQEHNPHLNLAMLQEALKDNFHSVLDFIIQLLGVAGESEDCELLSRSLRNPNPKVRSQVIETLEKTCEGHIFVELYPLVADLPSAERARAYARQGCVALSLTELLDKMSQSPTHGDRIIATAFRYCLDIPNWRESLREQMATDAQIFPKFAYELLET